MTGRSVVYAFSFSLSFFFISFFPSSIVVFFSLFLSLYSPVTPLPLSMLAPVFSQRFFLFAIVNVLSSFLYSFRDPIFVRAIVYFKAGLFCAGIFTIWCSTTVLMGMHLYMQCFISLRARSLHVLKHENLSTCLSAVYFTRQFLI